MYCDCGYPAVACGGRGDGKVHFRCGSTDKSQQRCRLYAAKPVRVCNMAYVMPKNGEHNVVQLEGLLDPVYRKPSFRVRVKGHAILGGEGIQALLGEGKPHYMEESEKNTRTVIFPWLKYGEILRRVRELAPLCVEEIPNCVLTAIERQRSQQQQGEQVSLANHHDSMFEQLKPFQRAGVEFIVSRGGRGMIADEMGLGKTIQSLAVLHYYRSEWPALVICPVSLIENWVNECVEWLQVPVGRICALQGGNKKQVPDGAAIVIVGYSNLKLVKDMDFSVVVCDESHTIKNPSAKRTREAQELCHRAKRIVLLSGTPTLSRPIELYAQLQTLHKSFGMSRYQFAERYCNGYISDFGENFTGHAHIPELQLLSSFLVIRRTKREVLTELPSKSRQLLHVNVTRKEKLEMAPALADLRRSCANGGGGLSRGTPNAFSLRQQTASAKRGAVADYVKELLQGMRDQVDNEGKQEKFILFGHHQQMIECLQNAVRGVEKKTPIDFVTITGDTPPSEREKLANHFRTDEHCLVAILSMQACGVGHNFTCANTVIFSELDWNPSTHLQCEDRVHRMGQDTPCTIIYLLAKDTADDIVWPLLQTKLDITQRIVDEPAVTTGNGVSLVKGSESSNVQRTDVIAPSSSPATTDKSQPTLDIWLGKPSSSSNNSVKDSQPPKAEKIQDTEGKRRKSGSPLLQERDLLVNTLHQTTSNNRCGKEEVSLLTDKLVLPMTTASPQQTTLDVWLQKQAASTSTTATSKSTNNPTAAVAPPPVAAVPTSVVGMKVATVGAASPLPTSAPPAAAPLLVGSADVRSGSSPPPTVGGRASSSKKKTMFLSTLSPVARQSVAHSAVSSTTSIGGGGGGISPPPVMCVAQPPQSSSSSTAAAKPGPRKTMFVVPVSSSSGINMNCGDDDGGGSRTSRKRDRSEELFVE